MQFKVPQFLEIEDKIFGPFTFREFAYLAGGGGMCFVCYKALGLFWGAVPILLIAGLSLLLTYYKPNDKPFINMVEAFFKYTLQDKLYIWERRRKEPGEKEKKNTNTTLGPVHPGARLTGNKLRDLAWSLDVLDTAKQASRGEAGR